MAKEVVDLKRIMLTRDWNICSDVSIKTLNCRRDFCSREVLFLRQECSAAGDIARCSWVSLQVVLTTLFSLLLVGSPSSRPSSRSHTVLSQSALTSYVSTLSSPPTQLDSSHSARCRHGMASELKKMISDKMQDPFFGPERPQGDAGGKKINRRPKPEDYTSEGVKDHDIFNLPSSDWSILGGLTLLALIVRLFRIYQPPSVVFDEVHFGGFASKYIKGKFFMDVHPPLAKLLLTLAGWLAGFDGNFDFKEIGKDYLQPGVPYVAMRLLPAICGVLTIPTIFLTLKASGCRTFTSAFGALLLTFENGFLTQSRLILLDSPLIFCTAFTALAFTCFTNQQEQGPAKAFSPSWWFWLATTGLGLGTTVSVKWVGLFTIAWVGSLTVLQLWVLLGDTRTVTPVNRLHAPALD